ncbi:LexA family transcriptional regulator [Croceicoccus sp. YJ47]|uniref:LexA family protein n=1 Tax=Croceicoccus sp. YJ47 TaxID=2798724 RepID=UPI001923D10E|nr:S24 family peptidase [Croceicoccus sp. YJ47]QQN73928.1 hypothetical protein JD971_14455 [Croceicoccus sp. YJ47]
MIQRISNPRGNIGDSHHGGLFSISGYAAQLKMHTGMGATRRIRPSMEKTPDQRRDILRNYIKSNGLKIASWAKSSGVDKNSIYNFLNGHSNALDPRTYAKLARTAQVPSWQLSGDEPEVSSPTSVMVSGEVQAGVFKEAVEWESHESFAVDVPVPSRFQGMARALRVAGNSMNKEFKEGSIVIWVKMLDFRPPRDGDHVVVYSHAHDDTIEATLKQYRVDGEGGKWLWPQSDHPDHQMPLNTNNPPENIRSIEVVGIVIGDYRQRVL